MLNSTGSSPEQYGSISIHCKDLLTHLKIYIFCTVIYMSHLSSFYHDSLIKFILYNIFNIKQIETLKKCKIPLHYLITHIFIK